MKKRLFLGLLACAALLPLASCERLPAPINGLNSEIDTGSYTVKLVGVEATAKKLASGGKAPIATSDFIISFELFNIRDESPFSYDNIVMIADQDIFLPDEELSYQLNGGQTLDNNFIENPKVAFRGVPIDDESLGIKFMSANFRVSREVFN